MFFIVDYNGENYKFNRPEDFHLWRDVSRHAKDTNNPQLTKELFSTLTSLRLMEEIEF